MRRDLVSSVVPVKHAGTGSFFFFFFCFLLLVLFFIAGDKEDRGRVVLGM